MKRLFSAVLAAILIINASFYAYAEDSEFSIEEVAVCLINDALTQPNVFGLPDLTGVNVYICDPVYPYALTETGLQACEGIVHYLIRTEQEFVGCITLCYKDSVLLSTSLNLDIAARLNEVCDVEDAFQLVVREGSLYVKTTSEAIVSICDDMDETAIAIANEEGQMKKATIKSQLTGIVTDPIVTRANVILDVPYVSQEGLDICWAAAAAAFGRYHTGSAYANYSASALAAMVGVGNQGASFTAARKILTDIFHINTFYFSYRFTDSETKFVLDQNEPIIAGFTGTNLTNDESVAHMVVLCGYKTSLFSSKLTYYIRDSNNRSVISVVAQSADVLAMDYYSEKIMFWTESAYRNYSQ